MARNKSNQTYRNFTFSAIAIFVFWVSPILNAQNPERDFLVYFRDKQGTPFSLSQPRQFLTNRSIQRRIKQGIPLNNRDLPVNPAYINQLDSLTGVTVLYTSKWLNAAVVSADTNLASNFNILPFVLNSARLSSASDFEMGKPGLNNSLFQPNPNICAFAHTDSTINYGAGANQIKIMAADSLQALGYNGSGKIIAVLDAGFQNVPRHRAFEHLRKSNRILGVYDFVQHDSSLYEGHPHGAEVLSLIAAKDTGFMVGSGFGASFYLFRTEDAPTEKRIELANWLIAAERADSLGVDLINSSLGYSNGFTDPRQDYSFANMNGRTTPAALAAKYAASVGILVVIAAGNQGNDLVWGGHIGSPGDADSIITAGAVDVAGSYAAFSSRGPTADGRIKPDLSAVGSGNTIVDPSTIDSYGSGSGTSFASPLLCGLAASFWQAHPNLTNIQVIKALKDAGSQAANPDNNLGWGIPNVMKAHRRNIAITNTSYNFSKGRAFIVYPNPVNNGLVGISSPNVEKLQTLTEINLSDNLGRLIYTHKTLPSDLNGVNYNFNLPLLPAGIYMLGLVSGSDFEVIRVEVR